MLCPKCQAENREEARFCDQCGCALHDAEETGDDTPSENTLDDTAADEEPLVEDFDDDDVQMQAVSEGSSLESDGVALDEATTDAQDTRYSIAGDEEDAGANDDGEAPSLIDDPSQDDTSIETDYELYQPVESERTDSIEQASNVDKLVFGDEDIPLPVSPRRTTDLSGFDRHSDEYEERLVDANYKPPEPAFRDGGTMQMPRVDSEEAQQSHDYLATNTAEPKKHGKTVGIVIAVLAVVAAACVFGTYQLGLWGGKIIPDVVGMTEADARSILADAGFKTRSEQVKSDDTEGLVLLMDPSSGNRAEEGSEIVINIATARTIPDVEGKKQEEAETILAEEGYENVKIKKQNSDKPKGTVIAVSPKAGSRSISSAEVTLTIAQSYTVPDVTNLSWDDAVDAITKAGLGYDVVYISTDDYPEGTIIGSEPAAGTEVTKDTYVVIQITQARGAELEDLASEMLSPGSTVEVNGAEYVVDSLDSVAYEGDDTVSYTITGHEQRYVFGMGIMNPDSETVSGTITFNDDNEVVDM